MIAIDIISFRSDGSSQEYIRIYIYRHMQPYIHTIHTYIYTYIYAHTHRFFRYVSLS